MNRCPYTQTWAHAFMFDGPPDPPASASQVEIADHLIWNGRSRVYWRANRCGYTADLLEAGLYTKEEAESLARNNDDEHERAVPFAEKREEFERIRARAEQVLARLSPASASVRREDACQVHPVSSRVCERGTMSCTVRHSCER